MKTIKFTDEEILELKKLISWFDEYHTDEYDQFENDDVKQWTMDDVDDQIRIGDEIISILRSKL
ncbi:MAG: hypothetical protein FWG20_05015 [Candidatus Cloacimonetes bacterium]|nr:hypothetical protein [Candidatus Cloacimonadota bacterium]